MSAALPTLTKAEWRARARANRAGLRVDHARIRVGLMRHFERYPPSGWVVAYSALPGEPDLAPLFAGGASTATAPRFALTRTPEVGMDLTVHPADAALETHPFGFLQPTVEAPTINPDQIGVVLVPGLAFDMQGTRLGHGAGYYDRFLATLPVSVARIGVSDGYITSELPREDHDIPMTHLASEVGVVALSWR